MTLGQQRITCWGLASDRRLTIHQGLENTLPPYMLHKKLASTGQTALDKFIAERKTLQFSVFLYYHCVPSKWILLHFYFFIHLHLTVRVFNILTKKFKGHVTVIISPIDDCDNHLYGVRFQSHCRGSAPSCKARIAYDSISTYHQHTVLRCATFFMLSP